MKKHYHLIGIGGIGMGGLARLLLQKGFSVSGSDAKDSAMTQTLRELGAKVTIGHTAANIQGADCVVYSSAIKEDNPEFAAAHQKNITIIRRAKLLSMLMEDSTGITIAGAHGKTTTSSMVSHMLAHAGFAPTTAVGGIVQNTNSNANLGEGKYFVAEVDESDGSFLYFSPHYSIITNIDLEHLDFYQGWEDLIEHYRQFIDRTDPQGLIIACGEDTRLKRLCKNSYRKHKTYGFSSDRDIWADSIKLEHTQTTFCVHTAKGVLGEFTLHVPGKHNVSNALACIMLGLELKIPLAAIQESLETFRGVQRRFQLIGQVHGVSVYDDYAHHPTEIQATLDASKQFQKNRLIAIFQPHRYSRFHALFRGFVRSLRHCDALIVTDIYAASEKPIPGVSIQQFITEYHKTCSVPVTHLKRADIAAHVARMALPQDLVITLGAGDITQTAYEIVEKLKQKDMKAAHSIAKGGVR